MGRDPKGALLRRYSSKILFLKETHSSEDELNLVKRADKGGWRGLARQGNVRLFRSGYGFKESDLKNGLLRGILGSLSCRRTVRLEALLSVARRADRNIRRISFVTVNPDTDLSGSTFLMPFGRRELRRRSCGPSPSTERESISFGWDPATFRQPFSRQGATGPAGSSMARARNSDRSSCIFAVPEGCWARNTRYDWYSSSSALLCVVSLFPCSRVRSMRRMFWCGALQAFGYAR